MRSTRLLHDLLREAAKSAPIVVVMDDIHWLDPTSLSFFADLGASRAPLMLLGATRGPDANPAVRKRLAEVEDVQWLLAEPMDAEDTGRLVARTLGAREADEDLAAMFRDRTGGNPLFVEELSRMAFANRLLFIDGAVQARSSVAATKGELDGILERQGLPGTIEGVIRRRLDGLSHQDVSVLRAASVVGQSFDRDLCSVGAPTLTPVEVERSLAALTGLGVIEPSDRGPDEFVFRHAVLRDVVYNAMSFAERRQIHDAIGSRIEQHPHTEDVSALLGAPFPSGAKKRQGDPLPDRGRRESPSGVTPMRKPPSFSCARTSWSMGLRTRMRTSVRARPKKLTFRCSSAAHSLACRATRTAEPTTRPA